MKVNFQCLKFYSKLIQVLQFIHIYSYFSLKFLIYIYQVLSQNKFLAYLQPNHQNHQLQFLQKSLTITRPFTSIHIILLNSWVQNTHPFIIFTTSSSKLTNFITFFCIFFINSISNKNFNLIFTPLSLLMHVILLICDIMSPFQIEKLNKLKEAQTQISSITCINKLNLSILFFCSDLISSI